MKILEEHRLTKKIVWAWLHMRIYRNEYAAVIDKKADLFCFIKAEPLKAFGIVRYCVSYVWKGGMPRANVFNEKYGLKHADSFEEALQVARQSIINRKQQDEKSRVFKRLRTNAKG